jgi:IPTL-CTERM motif
MKSTVFIDGMKRKFFLFVMVLSLVTFLSGSALAANLLQNPHFAGDLSGWNAGISTYDGTLDATGVSGSGSAKHVFVNNFNGGAGTVALSQCLTSFVPGQPYIFGGKVYMPSGQSIQGTGSIVVSWFTGTDCSTGFISSANVGTSFGDPADVWTPLNHPAVTIPANARSVWFSGQNGAASAGSHQTNFDDMYFSDAAVAATSVPTLNEWGLIIFMLAAGFYSVGTLRKRRRKV